MAEHFRKTKPKGCLYPIDGWGSHCIHSPFVPDTARVVWDLKRLSSTGWHGQETQRAASLSILTDRTMAAVSHWQS